MACICGLARPANHLINVHGEREDDLDDFGPTWTERSDDADTRKSDTEPYTLPR
jgi:hypothetical protein